MVKAHRRKQQEMEIEGVVADRVAGRVSGVGRGGEDKKVSVVEGSGGEKEFVLGDIKPFERIGSEGSGSTLIGSGSDGEDGKKGKGRGR